MHGHIVHRHVTPGHQVGEDKIVEVDDKRRHVTPGHQVGDDTIVEIDDKRRHVTPGHQVGENAIVEIDASLANIVERADAAKVATVYSVVYVTASATFSGSTAGYVTLGATSSATSSTSSTSKSSSHSSSSTTSSASSTTSSSSTSATVASTSSSAFSSSSSSTSSASSSSSSTPTTSTAVATSSSSATSSLTEDASSGLSSAAKGGVAIAVILLVALFAGLAFFFYRRKKNQQGAMGAAERLADDEKRPVPPPHDLPAAGAALPPRKQAPAPRLSIRPTSRFSMGADPEKTAAVLGAIAEIDRRKSPWERAQKPNGENPFGSHAETVNGQNVPMTNFAASQSTPSFGSQGSGVPLVSSPFGAQLNSAAPASAPLVAAGPAAAAAAATAGAATNNVHRVQLEFKPSMDDELELKVGSLIRVLHEYDDGWALCMTMDRSKQGVAPRTCLSKLPLKPRPAGPPQQGRAPGTPSGQATRKVSEPPRPSSLVPAPLSPQKSPAQRSASGPELGSLPASPSVPVPAVPQVMTRDRSASAGSGATTSSPTRKAVPTRKPVPGPTS